jgi:hypothetical protein
MQVKELLNLYAYFTLVAVGVSLAVKFGRLAALALRNRIFHLRPVPTGNVPVSQTVWRAARQALCIPIKQFHSKANKTWTRGYAFYHIAIITLMLGYAFSAVLLAGKAFRGSPVPDIKSGAASPESYTPANFLAIIFGNAELVQRHFLFGMYASVFLVVTWCEVACAVFGNCCLMVTLLGGRCGAVRGDLDESSQGLRTRGEFSWQHFVVRFLIFSIIIMEILNRLDLAPRLVYLHAAAGLTLILLMPFLYLRHILFVPLALYLAVIKRRQGIVA